MKPDQRVFVGVVAPIDPHVETRRGSARPRPRGGASTSRSSSWARPTIAASRPSATTRRRRRDTAFAKIRARVDGHRARGRRRSEHVEWRHLDDEEQLLRSVALQNANSILLARQRAEEELLRTKEALRESQERLTAALRGGRHRHVPLEHPTEHRRVGRQLDRLFGLESDRTTPSRSTRSSPPCTPTTGPACCARCERCARDGSDFDMEFRVVWPDGSVHWIDEKARTSFDAAGMPLYMTGACARHHQPQASGRGAARERESACARSSTQAAVGIAVAAPRRPLPRHEPASSPRFSATAPTSSAT